MKLLSGEYYRSNLTNKKANIGSGNAFDTVRQQAITWTNAEPDLCQHIASLGHNG